MSHAYLAIAIVSEVIGTTALKSSAGFTRLIPALFVVVGYSAAFYFLSLALRSIPVGVAYAIWSGAGIALVSVVGWVVFGQRLDLGAIICMALITAGVLVLYFFSHAPG